MSKTPVSIRVRPMYREELNEVLQLIHQTIRTSNSKDYTPQQIDKIIRTYNRKALESGTILVAEHRSQIVGMAKAGFCFLGSQSIEAVFTHPQFIHQGIGRTLVSEIERKAMLRNIKKLSVLASVTAVGFYQSLHYERLGKILMVTNIPGIYMEKQRTPFTFIDQVVNIGLLVMGLLAIFGVLYGLVCLCGYFLIYGA